MELLLSKWISKLPALTKALWKLLLIKRREGRLHILSKMAEALDAAREDVKEYAPRVMVHLPLPKDKIREVIGSGGKVIREICETTGAKIDISDDGVINVSGATPTLFMRRKKGFVA
jgi:polyribonucleotide nucleotidyltransferase